MRSRLAALWLAAAATSLLTLAGAALGASGSTVLVSGPNVRDGSFPIDDQVPAISADGRFVAFVRDFYSSGSAVYLRNMSGGTTPVDVPSEKGQEGAGPGAGNPSISGDGRYLAFASEDPGVSNEDRDTVTTPAGDTFPLRDIFVFERESGRVILVSRGSGVKGTPGNEDSSLPSISADGRYVAFQTEATDVLHGTFGGVFVRDLRTHTTTLASRGKGAGGKPLNGGFSPSISAHGDWVAFLTTAHLHPGNALEVAVRNMRTKRTLFASRAGGRHGALANRDCSRPAISANGRYVAFATKATNLGLGRNSTEDVFVRDLKTGRTILASRGRGKHGAAGNGDSTHPSLSAGGRQLAFESYASNLGPRDNGAVPDVFVRDLHNGRVFLASRAPGGGPANAPSADPSLSGDGRFVAFDSRGSNLSPADSLHATSVFRYRLP
jgi:Tol biopolymer transport system component